MEWFFLGAPKRWAAWVAVRLVRNVYRRLEHASGRPQRWLGRRNLLACSVTYADFRKAPLLALRCTSLN